MNETAQAYLAARGMEAFMSRGRDVTYARRRLVEHLHAAALKRGHESLSHYVRAYPLRPLSEIGNELCGNGVAGRSVELVLVQEATRDGRLEQCARDLLSRALASIPGGWPGSPSRWTRQHKFCVTRVLMNWLPHGVVDVRTPVLAGITTALLSRVDLVPGWKPFGPEDPVIADAFQRSWPRWPEEELTTRAAAFAAELASFERKCDQFREVLRSRGTRRRIESSAAHARTLWFSARHLYIRLAALGRASHPQLARAREELSAGRLALRALIFHARSQVPEIRVREVLDNLEDAGALPV